MRRMTETYLKNLLLMTILIVCFENIMAQGSKDTRVSVVQETSSNRAWGCSLEEGVYDESSFKKLASREQCADLIKGLKPDFNNRTIIGYKAGGDCMAHAAIDISRNNDEKKYKIKVRIFLGGCRSAGNFQGLLVVKKFQPDYQVEFSRTVFDQYGREEKQFDEASAMPLPSGKTSGPELLDTRPFEMKGCIKPPLEKLSVIKDREAFEKAVDPDIFHDQCLKSLEEIDFSKYALLGTTLKSYSPLYAGTLKYRLVKDDVKKQYLLDVSYPEVNNMCRCIYTLDARILVPKLPADYDVKLEIKSIPSDEK